VAAIELNAAFNSIESPRPACLLDPPQSNEQVMHTATLVMTSAALGLLAFSAGAASIDPTAEWRFGVCSRGL
jgi:hypothetical protein